MITAWFKLLTPFFTPIFDALKNFAMGIFIYRAGKKDAKLDSLKAEGKQIEKSKRIASGVDGLSDAELRKLLKSARKPLKPKKP